MKLSQVSIHAWMLENNIKTESGMPLDFKNHLYMFDVYSDLSPLQAIMKAAQVTMSTAATLKSLWVAKNIQMDMIYTLPTESDRNAFVGGKVNRMIAQNPILQRWTADKDSIEQKIVGQNIIHYRGTWTQKAAIMIPSDLNIYDEVDASKADVIEQYSTRLQHSKFKWEWRFSHPSAEGTGVDKYYQQSTQNHWFIKCPHCNYFQYIAWPHSIDQEKKIFICKKCKKELSPDDRRKGQWVKKYSKREISGYWIPLLICPWVSAKEIIGYQKEKSEEYFYNKVLGLPYVGGGNKLTKAYLLQNLTKDILTPPNNERIVIGIDTGKHLHYVIGGKYGIFYYDVATPTEDNDKDPYNDIRALMNRWPKAIAVIDQGGDLIGSRKLREDYPGRVFLCSYGADRKTKELVRWGKNDEHGAVIADRNRMIQIVVDEFIDKRIPLQGTEKDFYDYWLHWNNLTRVKEVDPKTNDIKRKIWVRSGDDHWAHATVYWRVGVSRFGSEDGKVLMGASPFKNMPAAPEIMPGGIVIGKHPNPQRHMDKFIEQDDKSDWRDID
ncbi:MAG: phage terminase large subunit family protein [Patescibacteria group bacterium]|jgi:hypothetical protein